MVTVRRYASTAVLHVHLGVRRGIAKRIGVLAAHGHPTVKSTAAARSGVAHGHARKSGALMDRSPLLAAFAPALHRVPCH